MKVPYKMVIFDGDGQTFPKFPKNQVCNVFTISPKTRYRDEVDFSYADKHKNFLQVYFNTLGIKVSYKLILSLLMHMIKHSQRTQISKFAISLHYLKKEVKDGVHFLHLDKH